MSAGRKQEYLIGFRPNHTFISFPTLSCSDWGIMHISETQDRLGHLPIAWKYNWSEDQMKASVIGNPGALILYMIYKFISFTMIKLATMKTN